ncbi:MAG: hypothetical protein U1E76_09670 [Planctomycetota bacterium]
MRWQLGWLAVWCVAVLGRDARGQFTTIRDGEVITQAADGEPVEEPAPAPAPAAQASKNPRVERLKKLTFDRRPSIILKTWSTPAEDDQQPAAAAEATVPAPDDSADSVLEGPELPPEVAAEEQRKHARAEEARLKAAAEAAKQKAFEAELKLCQRNVTLGDWAAVRTYVASLNAEEGKALYEQLLQSLQRGPAQRSQLPPEIQAYAEKNAFSTDDVLGLINAAPYEPAEANLSTLGQILRQALDQGHQLETFLSRMRLELKAEGFRLKRHHVAVLLAGANELVAAGEFVPGVDDLTKANYREGLNLLARHYLAVYDKEKKTELLEKAWNVTQLALAEGEVKPAAKEEALKRAVELAPKLRAELGEAWLCDSFTQRVERGQEILSAIGSSASLGMQSQARQPELRAKWLELQATAAKALLKAAPQRAAQWRAPLGTLASNWLKEAVFTYQHDSSTSLGPRLQRDTYGNFYYWEDEARMQAEMNTRPQAIKTGTILESRPSDAWLQLLDDTLKPKFGMILAQLLLKVGEEADAFPYIEQIAATQPRATQELVDEFLRVWTRNHDPNASRNRGSSYMFMYGFEERADSIPLTRSKQDRNLEELSQWVLRLRKLPVKIDEKLVANAFTTAHSTAEVYRIDVIERIFGSLKDLAPDTLAELAQKMRANLATVWRDPALQKDKKTNRRPQDIQNEVLHGYDVARTTIERALEQHPGSWALTLAKAALAHDENSYRSEAKKDSGFSQRRAAALGEFRQAAELYAAQGDELTQEKETTSAYEMWFYAALGASDLKMVNHESQLAPDEIPKIRAALQSLPGERGKRHMDLFTNQLFTRMSSVNPAVKFRYVRAGLDIVGDHKLAREVQQLFHYYSDLVTEIKLDARIDGDGRVGHGEPFGLFVDLRHTREIERESAGFSKYLTNQNNQYFSWNYGRPTEDYRDKFEEAARAALAEQFEVLSVTFNRPEVRSKALAEYGWRVTPYAYFLLKPKGPQVDRVPPLRLDLDFLDTTGYVILPVESAPVPIDAAPDRGAERPFTNLKLTQTLDERQAKNGKLLVEVKATAFGLPPDLQSLLVLEPAGFDIAAVSDSGASVVKFDDENEATNVVAERIWSVTLKAKDDLEHRPETFTFGQPKVDVASSELFRYADADLAKADATVTLEYHYGEPRRTWPWWLLGVVAAAACGLLLARLFRRRAVTHERRFRMPDSLSPFTVLGLLRDIERHNGLAADRQRELVQEIAALEQHFFVQDGGAKDPDLRGIAQTWIDRSS